MKSTWLTSQHRVDAVEWKLLLPRCLSWFSTLIAVSWHESVWSLAEGSRATSPNHLLAENLCTREVSYLPHHSHLLPIGSTEGCDSGLTLPLGFECP